jgi:LPXTG-motif cell wall-anchored protein
MTNSPGLPDWTDHDVSDPGVTLIQAALFTIGAVVLVSATAAVLRRRRRRTQPA